ncbi:hypothetical protein TRFO_15757 [Tritrichomonas foetus]|uniref:Uncharacterized protein n=1 Tax=Tritrichomonas foetus TaxID=1144522 RepID=A0A1J4KRT4_9EUKA|nr:hypothetical protein TRFO_15757 [Tritrichomonas foetus]|eukprot:OHT13983.1 hypothetical protein TRFO_15757 [Tritrichomonas foetus]
MDSSLLFSSLSIESDHKSTSKNQFNNNSISKNISDESLFAETEESNQNNTKGSVMRDGYQRLLAKIDTEIEQQKNETKNEHIQEIENKLLVEVREWINTWEECVMMATRVIPYHSIKAKDGTEQRSILVDVMKKLCKVALNVKESDEYKELKQKYKDDRKRLIKIESKCESLYSEVQKNRELIEKITRVNHESQKNHLSVFKQSTNHSFSDDDDTFLESLEKCKRLNREFSHKQTHNVPSSSISISESSSPIIEENLKIEQKEKQKKNQKAKKVEKKASNKTKKTDYSENLKRMMKIVSNLEKNYNEQKMGNEKFYNSESVSLEKLEKMHNSLIEVEHSVSNVSSTNGSRSKKSMYSDNSGYS